MTWYVAAEWYRPVCPVGRAMRHTAKHITFSCTPNTCCVFNYTYHLYTYMLNQANVYVVNCAVDAQQLFPCVSMKLQTDSEKESQT